MTSTEHKAYREKMEARLARLKAEMDELEAGLKEMKADARRVGGEHVGKLRQQVDAFKAKLGDLTSASGAAWDEARQGVSRAWDDLEDAFHTARRRFRHR